MNPSPSSKSISSNDENHIDVALYKAAAAGKFQDFNGCEGHEIESLRTPNLDTVLHVHLASKNYRRADAISSLSDMLAYKMLSWGWDACLVIDQMLINPLLVLEEAIGKRRTLSTGTGFVEQVLDKCPSLLQQENAKGEIPLHIAARYGDSTVVGFLIKWAQAAGGANGHDVEKQGMEAARRMLRTGDSEWNTALHIAARCGHLEVVRALLKFEDPAFSYSANKSQETPLYIAARHGYHRLVAEILNKCNSVAHGGPNGRTALHAAAMAGDKEGARIILEKKGELTRETDENGQTPLHYAAHLGHYSVAKVLLECDKSAAYIADRETEMTALLMAARQGHERIVRKIISYCPDCCDKADKKGRNLLHFVAIRHSPAELDLFLEGAYYRGSELYASIARLRDEKDGKGNTPLEVFLANESLYQEISESSLANFVTKQGHLRFASATQNKVEMEFCNENLSIKRKVRNY